MVINTPRSQHAPYPAPHMHLISPDHPVQSPMQASPARHLARSWRRSSLRLGLNIREAYKTSRSYFRSTSIRSCDDRDPDFGPLSVVPARIWPRQVFDIIADISCLIFKGPISVSIASFRVGRFEIRGQVARSKIQGSQIQGRRKAYNRWGHHPACT